MTREIPAPARRRLLAAASCLFLIGAPLWATHANALPASFVFVPPTSSPVFPDMAIAIIRPVIDGDLSAGEHGDRGRHRLLGRFSRAAALDIAKIVTAKGFHTSGSFAALDKITESDRQHATLLLDPHFHLNLKLANGSTTIAGGIDLAFIEPDTGEKIWIEHVSVSPFARPTTGTTSDDAALATMLGAFYPVMMRQIWDQLDPINIRMLAVKLVGD